MILQPQSDVVPATANHAASVLSKIDPILNDETLYNAEGGIDSILFTQNLAFFGTHFCYICFVCTS